MRNELTFNDVRLYGRAVKRWDLSDEVKVAIVSQMSEVLKESEDPKYKIGAAKVLLAAEAQNQKDEHAKVDEFNQRLLAIAQRCGIDINLLGFGDAASGSATAGAIAPASANDERPR